MTTPVLAILAPLSADGATMERLRPKVVPLATPVLRADDLGATRGDGAFETMHVRGNTAWLLQDHLDRLARSTERLHIVPPSRAQLAELVHTAIAAWPDDVEAGIKLVCSRGPEYIPDQHRLPTVYALVYPLPAGFPAARRDGVRVASLTIGISAEARASAPWLLGGVKSLSYAANMAALREAAGRDAEEVLLTTMDGVALEGPTSSVFWLTGDTLATTPHDLGILPGITVTAMFEAAGELGLRTEHRPIHVNELPQCDGVWLCSSVRGIVPVRELDGRPLPVSPHTETFSALLGFR